MPSHTLSVPVTHHLYVLTDTDAEEPDDTTPDPNGLVWINEAGDQANVKTGTSYGPVTITIDILDNAPTTQAEGWDDIVEVSMRFTGDGPMIGSLITDDLTDLDLAPDTWWRIRFHTRGRDAASAEADYPTHPDGTPMEHHLLQIWAAPHTPETRHQLTDPTGQRARAHSA
jgi:hypothetical protein